MDVALKYLEAGEMLTITGAWLDAQRQTFESVAEIRPLLDKVERAHHQLRGARRPGNAPPDAQLSEIITAQQAIDQRHDHALRALYYGMTAFAEHLLARESPDEAGADEVLHTRDTLFPEGRAGTQASYQAEAGNAERALQLALNEPRVARVVAEVHVSKRASGKVLLEQWASLGARLGELERRKAELLAAAGGEPDGRRISLQAAQYGWIRIVSTVLNILDHVEKPKKAVTALRRSVIEPAEKAARRYKAAARKSKGKKTPAAKPAGR